MECNEIREMLSAYVDDELSETQRELVETHVARCSFCEAALQSHAEMREQIGSLKETPPMRSLREAIMANVSGRSEGSPNPFKPVRWRQILLRPAWKPIAMVSLAVIIIASLVAVPPLLGDRSTARAESIALSDPRVIEALGDEPVDSAEVTEQTGDTATVEVTGRMGTVITVIVDLDSGTVMDFQLSIPQIFTDAELEEVLLILQTDLRTRAFFDEGATVLQIYISGGSMEEKRVTVLFALDNHLYKAEVAVAEGQLGSFEDQGEQPEQIAFWQTFLAEKKALSTELGLVTIPDVVTHESFSNGTSIQPEDIKQGRIILGIKTPEERASDPYRPTRFFKLDEGEVFEALYTVGMPLPKTYLVSVFVDYQQVEFEMDGKYGLLHEIYVPADTLMLIPLELGVLSPGVHDIQLVEFEDPYNPMINVGFERPYQSARIEGIRVVVGDSQEPALDLKVNTTATAADENEPLNTFLEFFSIGGAPGNNSWFVGRGTAGEPFQFQLISCTPADPGYEWISRAIIVLMDYHQVSYNGTSVFVSDVWKNERTIIDMEVTLSPGKRVHLVQAFTVPDPYQGVLGIFYTSPRVAIVGE